MVTAKHGNHSRDVGILLIYPNHEIPTAYIQAVQFAMISNSYAMMPEVKYSNRLRLEAFGQTLINPAFEDNTVNMKLHEKTYSHLEKVEEFLKNTNAEKSK